MKYKSKKCKIVNSFFLKTWIRKLNRSYRSYNVFSLSFAASNFSAPHQFVFDALCESFWERGLNGFESSQRKWIRGTARNHNGWTMLWTPNRLMNVKIQVINFLKNTHQIKLYLLTTAQKQNNKELLVADKYHRSRVNYFQVSNMFMDYNYL